MFKKILSAFLALAIGCTTPGLERGYTREVRLRPPDLDHPVDVNTDYALALSEWISYLGEKTGKHADKYMLTRAGQAVATLWLDGAVSYWSHEMGHAYNVPLDRDRGWDFEGGTNNAGLPKVDFKGGTTTLDNDLASVVGGLNKSESNARKLWERTDTITLDRATAFLAFKLDDSTYNIRAAYDEDDDFFRIRFFNRLPGKNEYLYAPTIPREATANDLNKTGVIFEYLGLPLGHGEKEIERRAVVADLLTVRNYESMWAIWKYVVTGQKTSTPLDFDVAGHKVVPPIVGTYLTKRGVFCNADFSVDGNKFSVGRNTDFPDWRVGVGLGERQVGCFSLSPFGAFNRIGGEDGFTLGTDIGFELGKNASLVFNLQKSEDDVIENGVKRVRDGTDVQAGWRVKW